MGYITRQEEMVLIAIYKLGKGASLVSIRHYLNENTDNHWRMSSIYILLDRLQKSGYLEYSIGDPTPVRGGRAKKFYRISNDGLKALRKVQKVNSLLWNGMSDLKPVH